MDSLCDSSVCLQSVPVIGKEETKLFALTKWTEICLLRSLLYHGIVLISSALQVESFLRDFIPEAHIFSFRFYRPEPHILLFRRPLGTDPQSGRVDPELERIAREEYKGQFGILRK
mmetsp:Transcript_31624/g.57258  ORF Transcript_31624/g.57258 Transcript_31624/m.57258 type:complete len:116 (-) Transcript_31624:253-600(-)